jgi:hypothetical protein
MPRVGEIVFRKVEGRGKLHYYEIIDTVSTVKYFGINDGITASAGTSIVPRLNSNGTLMLATQEEVTELENSR